MVRLVARWSSTEKLLLVVLLLDVAVVRWIALGTQFWLDEVWSWRLALEEMGSWADLLGSPRLQWDNNHLLNTAYIHLVGPQQDWRVYRLLAWVSGIASVAATAWITVRQSRVSRWVTLVLVAFSFPLAVHSSEARGYAPATMFALLAFGLQRLALERSRWWAPVLLQICVVLGYLSHLSFVFVHLALMAWSGWRLLSARAERARWMLRMALRWGSMHGVALLFFGALYWIHVRHSLSLPGPLYPLVRILRHTIAHSMGSPLDGGLAWLAAATVALAFACELACMARQGEDAWLFHLTAVALAPTLVIAALSPPTFYTRYFVVCLPFLYLVLGQLAGRLFARSRPLALCATLLVLLAVAGNLLRTYRFLAIGRGGYREALLEMARRTRGAEISVGSNNDACVADVLRFYSNLLPGGKRVRFRRGGVWVKSEAERLINPNPSRPLPTGERGLFVVDSWPRGGPDWLVVPSSEPVPERLPYVHIERGVRCWLKRIFPSYLLSGQTWYLYRCR